MRGSTESGGGAARRQGEPRWRAGNAVTREQSDRVLATESPAQGANEGCDRVLATESAAQGANEVSDRDSNPCRPTSPATTLHSHDDTHVVREPNTTHAVVGYGR